MIFDSDSPETNSESVKYSTKYFVSDKFRPIGCFTIDSEISRLTKNAVKDLKRLKTKEDVFNYIDDFGSHYPAPRNVFHYGGIQNLIDQK